MMDYRYSTDYTEAYQLLREGAQLIGKCQAEPRAGRKRIRQVCMLEVNPMGQICLYVMGDKVLALAADAQQQFVSLCKRRQLYYILPEVLAEPV